LEIADGIGAAAVPPARIVDHVGDVVVDQEAVKAVFLERQHDFKLVLEVALVDEALGEVVGCSLYITEVDVDDLAARGKVADAAQYVRLAAHLRPAADAEVEAEVGAVEGVGHALEALEVAEDARHAAQGGD